MKASIDQEKTIRKMIALYCRGNHGHRKSLCPQCSELQEYALERIEQCPIKEEKLFCSSCEIHCYKPHMREAILQIMRYSGPRMIWHSPLLAIRHVLAMRKTNQSRSSRKK